MLETFLGDMTRKHFEFFFFPDKNQGHFFRKDISLKIIRLLLQHDYYNQIRRPYLYRKLWKCRFKLAYFTTIWPLKKRKPFNMAFPVHLESEHKHFSPSF